ncbi:MAG: hypothetical protein J6K92_11570 [Oscillospiraceae bacterium]|nr:hypothetical protein [Oscillospiraceae bacterium]
MSRNRKYIEQFDRNAGKPADFDSLFDFEKNKLIAKRRIKMKSSRSYAAAMCSAAAVIGIAAFAALAYINERGIASDSVMSKSTGDITSEITAYIEEKSSVELIPLIDRFEYDVTGDMSGNAELLRQYSSETDTQKAYITDWQAVMRFRVVSKKYDFGKIVYCVKPLEYYAEEDFSEIISGNETVTFSVHSYDLRELQIGKEYIMPFMAYNSDENNGDSEDPSAMLYADNTGYYAQKTDMGWLIYNCGMYRSDLLEAMEADTEEVFDNFNGTSFYHLEPSDEKMSEKIRTFLESRDEVYYHVELGSSTAQVDLKEILPNAEFENVRYFVNENGVPDRTLLVLDNEQYFSLLPHISGYVVFAGRALSDNLCAAVELVYYGKHGDDYYCRTILMSGFSELSVSTGDSIDENAAIGVCSNEPVYMQFIDNNGMPMEIRLDNNTEETTVIMAE